MDVISPVVVLDGEQRAALAVVRSLGRRGFQVHVGAAEPGAMAGGSRYAVSETCLPDPLGGTLLYCDAVARLAAARRASLVFPVTEASILAVLENPDRLAGLTIPMGNLDRFRRASDKEAVLQTAAGLGIAVPAQWRLLGNSAEELALVPDSAFPVVIKPARSVVGIQGSRRKVGVRYATSREELARVIGELGPEAGPFLIQVRVEGPGLGIFLLRWNGRILARFAHRRIREKPPSGGVSVCAESVAAPAALVEEATALLAALDWQGVAMVEYKHDIRSGRNYLMEINPRFWGSLQLAIDAGVDFPWHLARAALGESFEPVTDWRVGIRSRWYFGEVDHLIARLRRGRAELGLPDGEAGLLRTIAAMITPRVSRQRGDVFRLSDPKPALREAVAWVRALRS